MYSRDIFFFLELFLVNLGSVSFVFLESQTRIQKGIGLHEFVTKNLCYNRCSRYFWDFTVSAYDIYWFFRQLVKKKTIVSIDTHTVDFAGVYFSQHFLKRATHGFVIGFFDTKSVDILRVDDSDSEKYIRIFSIGTFYEFMKNLLSFFWRKFFGVFQLSQKRRTQSMRRVKSYTTRDHRTRPWSSTGFVDSYFVHSCKVFKKAKKSRIFTKKVFHTNICSSLDFFRFLDIMHVYIIFLISFLMEPRDDVAWILFEVEHMKNASQLDEALKKLEDGLVKHSQDYRLYEEIADIYLYKGDLEKAEKAVDFALLQNATSATGNYLKGFILLSAGKNIQAIEYLEASNNILPNNSEVIRNLGWAYVSGTAEKEK